MVDMSRSDNRGRISKTQREVHSGVDRRDRESQTESFLYQVRVLKRRKSSIDSDRRRRVNLLSLFGFRFGGMLAQRVGGHAYEAPTSASVTR